MLTIKVQVNLCLGRLYVAVNLRKNALPALKSVLLSCPFALEAIESLIDIGIDGDELLEIVRKSSRDNSILKGLATTTPQKQIKLIAFHYGLGWLESYTAALLYKRECSYTKCDNQVKKLAAVSECVSSHFATLINLAFLVRYFRKMCMS